MMKPLLVSPKRFKSAMVLGAVVLVITLAIFLPLYGESAEHSEHGTTQEAQGAAHEAQGESHEAHGGGWAATDWQRVLNFGILAGALFMILRKPAAQMLSDRIKGIQEQLAELEEKKQQAEKELAQYNEKLTQLAKEGERIVDEYVRQGQEARERILAEAKASAGKLEEKAMKNIDHEFMQAKLKLQAEITEMALARAQEKIIGAITLEDQNRLVDDYLEKVVAS